MMVVMMSTGAAKEPGCAQTSAKNAQAWQLNPSITTYLATLAHTCFCHPSEMPARPVWLHHLELVELFTSPLR